MVGEEEKVRNLVREMHDTVEHTPWLLSAEEIRGQRRRRAPQMPNPKILGLVAAVVILILVGVLVGTSISSGPHIAAPPTSTTTAPPRTTTTTTHPPQVTVPELVGESQAQAESDLTNLGLTVGPVDLAPSVGITGTVIAQVPGAGSLIAPGSEVVITVSSGQPAAAASGANANVPVNSDAVSSPSSHLAASASTASASGRT
jgi:hypothetical protein